jgi:hypothetical protein
MPHHPTALSITVDRMRLLRTACALAVVVLLHTGAATAQSAANVDALRGLAPVAALNESEAGKKALADNLAITGAIQSGAAQQPTLLLFPEQQQQALRDAFIGYGNAADLADGLGSKLAAVYQSRATVTSTNGGKTVIFANISPAIADIIAYANATTRSDAQSGKYFFANATTDKTTPVSQAAMEILTETHGVLDVFGRAYGRPAGSQGADTYGNSRPFQTEPQLTQFSGKDYFGTQTTNATYLHGPIQNLTDSPSYPSGHTTYGYTQALVLALLVPQRYQQMIARGAEYGNDRIIMGAHYTMDVLGGRAVALHDMAQLLANKPGYVGVKHGNVQIDDFPKALAAARADLTKALESGCGNTIAVCADEDTSRFSVPAKNEAFYEATQTYGLATAHPLNTAPDDVAKLAPEAGYLLTAAFPYLTLAEANDILTATEGPGGGFLDNGSSFGVYSRLNLYKAAGQAIARAPGSGTPGSGTQAISQVPGSAPPAH